MMETGAIFRKVALVMDDVPLIRLLVEEALGEVGYIVFSASDGKVGLETLKANAQIDILITDIGLPGSLDGWQVAEAAVKFRPKLKTLFVTGDSGASTDASIQNAPNVSILIKPFTVKGLIRKVDELFSAQSA